MGSLTEAFLESLDNEFDNANVPALTEDDRAVSILRQCVKTYRANILGNMLSIQLDAIKEVSEVYGVPPALIQHAVDHGPANAHFSYKPKRDATPTSPVVPTPIVSCEPTTPPNSLNECVVNSNI